MEAVRRNIQQVGGLRLVMLAAALMAVVAACALGTYAYLHAASGAVKNSFQAYVPPYYELIYHANNGTTDTVVDHQDSSAESLEFVIAGHVPDAPENKVFMGWAETDNAALPTHAADGRGLNIDGQEVTTYASRITLHSPEREKHLYAVWATRYTITFSNNPKYGGQGGVPDTVTVVHGRGTHRFNIEAIKSDKSNLPYRDDYDFQWFAPGEDRKKDEPHVKHGEYIDLDENNPSLELYARYFPSSGVRIDYIKGIDGTINDFPSAQGLTVPSDLPNYPEWQVRIKDNFPTTAARSFLGWTKVEGGTEVQFNPGGYVPVNLDESSHVKLYAVWTQPHKFSITLHGNAEGATIGVIMNANYQPEWSGFSCTPSVTNAVPIKTITSREYNSQLEKSIVMKPGFYVGASRANYRFAGYSTDPDDNTVEYKVGNNGNLLDPITVTCENANCPGDCTHNLDLYAVWVPRHTLGIKFHLNNPKVPWTNAMTVSVSGGSTTYLTQERAILANSPALDVDQTSYTIPAGSLSAKCSNTTEYNFLGWAETPDATVDDIVHDLDGDTYGRVGTAVDLEVDLSEEPCEPGCRHVVKEYYAVWEPKHQFGVNLIWNTTNPVVNNAQYEVWIPYSNSTSGSGRDRTYWTESVPVSQKKVVIPAGSLMHIKDTKGLEFLGWSIYPNATTADEAYSVDENGRTKYDIELEMDDDSDCVGGQDPNVTNVYVPVRHTPLTLYAVWKGKHSFSVTFNRNGNGGNIVADQLEGGSSTSATWNEWTKRITKDLDAGDTSYTIPAGFKAYVGSREGYKFLGWSVDKTATRPDYDFEVDENYQFKRDITLGIPEGETCSADGEIHNSLTLYAVWQPLHAFGFRLHMNTSQYRFDRYSWTPDFSNWSSEDGYAYFLEDGFVRTAYKPLTTTSVVIPAGTWKGNVTWVRNYTFLGWSIHDDNSIDAEDRAYELDENGCFKREITISHTSSCEGGAVQHVIDLYPVLEPAHYLKITFEVGDADYITTGNSTTKPLEVKSPQLKRDQTSYTWDANTLYCWAVKQNYTFLGWSTNPNDSQPEFTRSDNAFGRYLAEPLTASLASHDIDTCEPGVAHDTGIHLYPIFEVAYELNYNANGGDTSSVPATQTYSDLKPYDGSHEFTIYDDRVNQDPPTRDQFGFVGWSRTKNAPFAEYGYLNNYNSDLGQVTGGLSSTITATPDDNPITLYAVWWYHYYFTFDANGGTGAPENGSFYSSGSPGTLTIPRNDIPTRTDSETGAVYPFLGWATKANATSPQYQPGDDVDIPGGRNGSGRIDLYAVWGDPVPAGGNGTSNTPGLGV